MARFVPTKAPIPWEHTWHSDDWATVFCKNYAKPVPSETLDLFYRGCWDPRRLAETLTEARWGLPELRQGRPRKLVNTFVPKPKRPVGRPRKNPEAPPKPRGPLGRPPMLLDVAGVDQKLAEALCRACGLLLGRRLTPEARRKVLEVLAQASRTAGLEEVDRAVFNGYT